jgi:GNAT superfamily N-acetyltransferase
VSIRYEVRRPVDDAELSRVHAQAFGGAHAETVPWSERLRRNSLTWVSAYESDRLIGFVNVIGDGGKHAVLLDTVVDPDWQGHGIGRGLVAQATEAARSAGCEWLHVDFEADLADFYLRACGFGATAAGLRRLH